MSSTDSPTPAAAAPPLLAIVCLSLAAGASAMAMRVNDALLPQLAQIFGVPLATTAQVVSFYALAYGAAQVLWGPIGDRFGKYRVVAWAVLACALASLACAFAGDFGQLRAARVLAGMLAAAIIPLSIAWIGDVVRYERRQPVLARFLIGHMFGISLAATASGWFGERHGWQAVFYALAGLYVAIAALLWFELKTNPVASAAPGARQPFAESFRRMAELTRLPWVRVVLATVFVEGALSYGALAFVSYDAHRRFGLGLGASGAMLVAFAFGGLLYASVAGRLVPAIGERGMVRAGGLLLGAGYLGLALAPTAALAVPCITTLGIGLYMLHNTLQVHATQMAPESRGAAVALFAFCLFGGQSTGVWLASHVVDTVGTRPVFIVAALALPVLALEFRRRLGSRRLR